MKRKILLHKINQYGFKITGYRQVTQVRSINTKMMEDTDAEDHIDYDYGVDLSDLGFSDINYWEYIADTPVDSVPTFFDVEGQVGNKYKSLNHLSEEQLEKVLVEWVKINDSNK